MLYPPERNIHRPLHLYLNNEIYFITSRTIEKEKFFNTEVKIKLLKKRIKQAVKKFGINLYAWVILPNHYHLLFLLPKGEDLAMVINSINGGSAHDLNLLENRQGRKIWYQYWDRCIKDEKDFWTLFNYIHNNPIKHGYIKNLDELKNFKNCSYQDYYRKYGEEWLMDCWRDYPVIDYTIPEDS